MGASFYLPYNVLNGNSGIFIHKGTSLWKSVSNTSPKCVIDLSGQGGRWDRDKLDRRRSIKLTLPPSSDSPSLEFITDDHQAVNRLQHDAVAQVN